MNRRIVIITTLVAAVLGLGLASFFYERLVAERQAAVAASENNDLVRPYSPIMGPANAKVTIVEFFDPACEACRAFYPVVKQLLAKYPKEVRLVLRYTPFHDGSEDAVRILETARLQGLFEPVLEAVLAAQPRWAAHGRSNLDSAWRAAGGVGLDLEKARRDASMPLIDAAIQQDVTDLKGRGVNQTPTFFVNGKPLLSFGRQQLEDLVKGEVEAARRSSPGAS